VLGAAVSIFCSGELTLSWRPEPEYNCSFAAVRQNPQDASRLGKTAHTLFRIRSLTFACSRAIMGERTREHYGYADGQGSGEGEARPTR
jgi:hypothetical protein